MVTEPRPRRWPRWLAQVVMGLALSALVIGGVVAVGNAARSAILPNDRYRIAFQDIECAAPPGKTRAEFLGEVQYLGRFPDAMQALDPALPGRLKEAFAGHPRVASVDKVVIAPPNRVRIELTFQP